MSTQHELEARVEQLEHRVESLERELYALTDEDRQSIRWAMIAKILVTQRPSIETIPTEMRGMLHRANVTRETS